MAKRNNKSALKKKCEDMQTKARQEVIQLQADDLKKTDRIKELTEENQKLNLKVEELKKWVEKLLKCVDMSEDEFKKHVSDINKVNDLSGSFLDILKVSFSDYLK